MSLDNQNEKDNIDSNTNLSDQNEKELSLETNNIQIKELKDISHIKETQTEHVQIGDNQEMNDQNANAEEEETKEIINYLPEIKEIEEINHNNDNENKDDNVDKHNDDDIPNPIFINDEELNPEIKEKEDDVLKNSEYKLNDEEITNNAVQMTDDKQFSETNRENEEEDDETIQSLEQLSNLYNNTHNNDNKINKNETIDEKTELLTTPQSISKVSVENQDASDLTADLQGTHQPLPAVPYEPGSRGDLAPRPSPTQRSKPLSEANEDDQIDDNNITVNRPNSAYSSYSYSYSYSEVEETITRPRPPRTKPPARKKRYLPKYLPLPPPPPPPTLPDDELEDLKRKALALQPLEDLQDEVYVALLHELIEMRNVSAADEDFRGSARLNFAIEHVKKCQLDQRKYNLQNASYNEMMDELEDIKRQIRDHDNRTNDLEKKLRQELSSQISRIEANHQKELDDLEIQWSSEHKRRQYNHASPRLVVLRKQFKQYMRQCKFQDAEETKAMIAKLEKIELESATIVIQTNYNEAAAKIEARQREEISFYKTKAEIKLKQLAINQEKLREALLYRQRKIEENEKMIADADKLWNCHLVLATKTQSTTPNAHNSNSNTNSNINTNMNSNMNTDSPTTTSRSTCRNVDSNTSGNQNAYSQAINVQSASKLTSRDFTDREETTLKLPPLKFKRSQRSVRSVRK